MRDYDVEEVDMKLFGDNVKNLPTTQVVNDLMPFTQYAIYVKTYTVAQENQGARSNISYFTTLPSGNYCLTFKLSVIIAVIHQMYDISG